MKNILKLTERLITVRRVALWTPPPEDSLEALMDKPTPLQVESAKEQAVALEDDLEEAVRVWVNAHHDAGLASELLVAFYEEHARSVFEE